MKTKISRLAALAMSFAALVCAAAAPTPRTLVAFGPEFKNSTLRTNDARAVVQPGALRVTTGTKENWPGVTLLAPSGTWDLSNDGFVEMDVKNLGSSAVTVSCRVDNAGTDGKNHCVTGNAKVEPGQTQVLHVELKRESNKQPNDKLFGMRGYPVAAGGPGTIDAAKVTQMLVFVTKSGGARQFEVSNIRVGGTYVRPTAWITDADPFFPFVDTFGQYKHKDWPGKIHSASELTRRRDAEAKELAASPCPAQWDKFGGWAAGPKREATGFFRAEKVDGKWWLVDPEGHLFFSHGIDCVHARHMTPVEERESWFEAFPGSTAEFKAFNGSGPTLKGHYAGKTTRTFGFNVANLQRKYGANWDEDSSKVLHQRLRSWGLNTIANWSDEKVRLMRKTPYTDTIGSRGVKMITGSEGYWGKFPDPFDPGFAQSLRKQMEAKRSTSVGDAWCIGYFSDNEMSWGDDTSIAVGALRSAPTQVAKQVFVADLRTKYSSIEKLNAAWGTQHGSWDALLQSTNAPDKKAAEVDLGAFYTKAAEKYFSTVRDAIKAVAPNQLYLGCRFAWVNDRAASAAAKYCDVVSYNLYKRSVADFKFNGGIDKPLIIGEFHFGALDRGMFHTGLVPVPDQKARAEAYRSYVEGALRHPQFVGCHWFEYQDEPLTGRAWDEENYQIGFVDVCDTPYPETVAACRAVAAKMYETRSGK